ncbi:MAG: hypothetical protein M3R08_00840 [Bacteroidota bacterium]|nr:hypothetical protein [Bacteroidota bacterium]
MTLTDIITLIGIGMSMIAAIAAAIMSARTQKNVAKYSAEQSLALADHEIKFSSLHRERVTKIIEIFHSILDIEQLMHHYLLKLQHTPTQDVREQAYTKMYDFLKESYASFYRHRFYFDEAMCNKIDAVYRVLHKIEEGVYDLKDSSITFWGGDYSPEERKEMGRKILAAHNQMQKDLKTALQDLQEEIRRLLGVIPQ